MNTFALLFQASIAILLLASVLGRTGVACTEEELSKLTNDALLREWESRGLKLHGLSCLTLTPLHRPGFGFSPESREYVAAKFEVARRGKEIEREVLELLRKESRTDRGPDTDNRQVRISLAGELMNIVQNYHSSEAASTLLKILDDDLLQVSEWSNDSARLRKAIELATAAGDQREAEELRDVEAKVAMQSQVKRAAITTMESVIFLTFRADGDTSLPRRAVGDGQALMNWTDVPEAARRYRVFLDADGKECKQWLPLAIDRAHQKLRDLSPDVRYCAAEFLSLDLRDTNPGMTCKVLSHTIAGLSVVDQDPKVRGRFYNWSFYGVPTQKNGLQWCCLLAEFRGYAQPYLQTVVELPKRAGFDAPYTSFAIGRIGGSDALVELQKILNEAPRHLESAKLYLALVDHDPSDPRGFWVQDQRFAREAFDRLAGQAFSSDEERTDWFSLHGKEPPQEWLKSSLSILAEQFDSEKPQVQMAMAVLPDFANEARVFLTNSEKTKPTPKLRAKQWIDVHAKDLQYDPITHTLVLRMKK